MPDWRGETVVIVASGPSAKEADFGLIKDHKVLVINEGWRLYPSAHMLYGCDRAWWELHGGLKAFKGIKVTQDKIAARHYGLSLITVRTAHEILTEKPGVVGHGGNGGFQGLNLAIQCGARRIVLVGFDMTVEGGVHWHGKHGGRLNNPTAALTRRWRERLDAIAPSLSAMGVEVINASSVSALTAYRKSTLADALG